MPGTCNKVTVEEQVINVTVSDSHNKVVVRDDRPIIVVDSPPPQQSCCPGGNTTIVEVGVPGPAGSATPYYVHEQATPATEWIVNHPLNMFPSVTVVDSARSVVIGHVQYMSPDQIILTFTVPFAGWAYLS